MHQASAARRTVLAIVLLGTVALSLRLDPSRAQTADPATLPPQPGTPAPQCTPKLGVPNAWDQLGEPLVLDGTATSNGKQAPFRSSVDPSRPCLVYRVAGDARALERSSDGGRTFERVFFDGRTSSVTGAPMRINGVFAPAADRVYLTEDGNGTSIVRSLDGGATWEPANQGLAGEVVRSVSFAPSNPDVGYAVAVRTVLSSTAIAVFLTTDAGDTWTPLRNATFANPLHDFQSYAIAVDPADPGHLVIGFQGAASVFGPDPPAGSPVLESHDHGRSFRLFRVPYQVVELLFARRSGQALRLYLIANGSRPETNHDNGVFYSDDAAGGWSEGSWREVRMQMRTTWHGGLIDPVVPDKILYFGRPYYEAPSRLFALYTRNGFVNQELVEQPAVRNAEYEITQYRVDRFGQFYIDVGFNCSNNPCPGGNDPNKSAWVTFRFRPPDPGQAVVIGTEEQAAPARTGSYAPAHRCTVDPQAPLHQVDSPDDAGSLAFDGTRLYYTRRGEQGPDPFSAVVRVADPTTCRETGRLVVRFDPEEYRAARKRAVSDWDGKSPLLPERPSIDSLAYDQVHDELWFGVTRTAPFVQPYNGDPDGSPFPVWAVPRSGPDLERRAGLRFWTAPCGQNGGVSLLAHDRAADTLWTCDRKVPGERTRQGRSRVTCIHPMFQGFISGGRDVWDIRAWDVGRPGVLVALNAGHGNSVDHYDARSCTHLDEWSPSGVLGSAPPQPRQGPTYVSSQLVCDPVTFRDRLGGAPAPPAVFWMRSGPQFTAYRVTPDSGPGLTCPWPTVSTYSGASNARAGEQFEACATVTVPGSGGTIPRVPVRISVDGAPARSALTDAAGRACVLHDVPAGTADGTRLAVVAEVAEDAHLLGSRAEGSVLVGVVPVAAAVAPVVPFVAPPPPPAPPPAVPLVPAPAPAAPAQVPSPAPAPPPAQVVAQQGMATEREREVQVATAAQEAEEEEQPEAAQAEAGGEDYGFEAVVGGSLAVALAGATVAALALRSATVPRASTAAAFVAVPRATRRRPRARIRDPRRT